MDNDLAFKVRTPDGKTYRIYASGRVEGFGPGAMIFNRIPHHVSQAVLQCRPEKAASNNPEVA